VALPWGRQVPCAARFTPRLRATSAADAGFGTTIVSILLPASSPGRAIVIEEPQLRIGTRPFEVFVAKITVSNLRRSLDFYTRMIGLKEFQMPGIPRPNVYLFELFCLPSRFVCIPDQRERRGSDSSFSKADIGGVQGGGHTCGD
jgi:hypothetical protein